jgi:DNA-binding response OmpR family regulator
MARILVIDDSPSVLEWILEALTHAGHDVVTASSGRGGVLSLRTAPVDLIITDIYMPEPDGLEVICQARRWAPEAKLIAMSSRPPERNLFAVASALGAMRALQKPFSSGQLLEAVAGSLREPRVGAALSPGTMVRLPPAQRTGSHPGGLAGEAEAPSAGQDSFTSGPGR